MTEHTLQRSNHLRYMVAVSVRGRRGTDWDAAASMADGRMMAVQLVWTNAWRRRTLRCAWRPSRRGTACFLCRIPGRSQMRPQRMVALERGRAARFEMQHCRSYL